MKKTALIILAVVAGCSVSPIGYGVGEFRLVDGIKFHYINQQGARELYGIFDKANENTMQVTQTSGIEKSQDIILAVANSFLNTSGKSNCQATGANKLNEPLLLQGQQNWKVNYQC